MPKKKKGRTTSPAKAETPQDPAPVHSKRIGEPELLAAIAIAICALQAWLARSALNPDGVSYLDLAGRAAAGDWTAFVQGYWSPLYPALVALVSSLTGRDSVTVTAVAHAINGIVATLAIALLWWWSRQIRHRFFTRAAIATILLISSGLPRIEAVTPDVLLLALMTWIGYELLVRRGERWLLTGTLLGFAFLTKTSTWPWLLLAIPLRAWGARDSTQRRSVLLSSVVCVLVMLTWMVPMSAKAGRLTLGSAGRLNYCWYIDACDSRTPDTHLGRHTAYHETAIDSTHQVVWAEFAEADRWTYAPWSDPTAWESGVLTRTSSAPTPWELVSYWGRQARNSFGLWLSPVLLGVLIPYGLINWRRDAKLRLFGGDRSVMVVAILGLAGVGQFILIHSEPRLIAPFGLLFALAVLQGLSAEGSEAPRLSMALRQALSVLGLVGVAVYAGIRLQGGFSSSHRLEAVISSMASTNASMAAQGLSQARIVVLGFALPIEAAAFLSGTHIVAQVLPGSVETIKAQSPEQQRTVIAEMFAGKAQIGWLTTSDGTVSIVVIPPK